MGRAMKDSGVEWIGEIPEEWNLIPLKRFTKINNGIEISEEVDRTSENAIPVYGSGGIFKYTNKPLYSGKAVLFGRKGTIGKPIYVNTSFWTVDTMYFLTYAQELDEKFSCYQLMVFDWDRYATKTALPSIVASQIVSCEFPIPPINEQRIIVGFLDSQCAEIGSILEKTRSSIEEYKHLKQAVITQAVTKGVRGERPMKESGIEWLESIPSTWKIVPIKYFTDILAGYAFSSDDFDINTGIPLLRGVNVTPKGIRWNDVVFWNKNVDEQLEAYMLRTGDLVLGLDRPWISEGARISWVSEKDIPSLLLQRVCRIRAKDGILPALIYYWLSSPLFMESLSTDTTGISVPHISSGQVGNFLISLPSIQEQEEIVAYLDKKCTEIDALITQKEQLLTELENYKKSLIYEYVTGKKEVPS